MLRRLEAAENDHTPDVVIEMMADDAVLMVPDFEVQEGREACAKFIREIDAFLAQTVHRRIQYVSAEVSVFGDVAFDRGSFSFVVSLKDVDDAVDAQINRGKYLILYTRALGGSWQIARVIVSRDEREDTLERAT